MDFNKLTKCAGLVKGYHDFSTFCVISSQKENNRCLVYKSVWRRHGNSIIYEIMADRFLHTMIRSLVGAMVNLATVQMDKNKQNLTLSGFGDMLKDSASGRSVFTAPAQGLYLVSVTYEEG